MMMICLQIGRVGLKRGVVIIQDETMPGGGRVRLTRARSKGGEINWDLQHLANFLEAQGGPAPHR